MGFLNKVGMKAKAAKKKYDKLSNELDKRKTARLEKQARNLELKAKVEKQRAEVEKYRASRRKSNMVGRPKQQQYGGLGGTGLNLGAYGGGEGYMESTGGSLFDNRASAPVRSSPKKRTRRKKSRKKRKR